MLASRLCGDWRGRSKNEQQELNCRLIDLDPAVSSPAAHADVLALELAAGSDENQLARRGDVRYAARLRTASDAIAAAEEEGDGKLALPAASAFRLRLGRAGSFDALKYESFSRPQPGPGQLEVEVHAAGLNFSDVLKALGLYPGITDLVVPLGIECSGIVTALGEGVDRFHVGQEVFGVAPYSFASHALTAEYAMVPKPTTMDHREACTVPITFLTAYYALRRLADLQPGERVLIHAGAGGVGLAAIQIAQHVGAEIFATAGSDRKRELLRSLGVKHIFSSRTVEFADEIMNVTDRQGVDVVLNSLPGDAITKSLAILRAYGRFLEIGKIDIYQNRMIGLLPFKDNLSYYAIDLDRMLRQRPELIRGLFREVIEHFQSGVYRPLPLTEFPAEDVTGAFRYMAQRKNIGKVVVSLEREPAAANAGSSDQLIRADGTYLITGGLGALGLLVADWLASRGAKHVALMARRAPGDESAAAVEALRGRGVCVATVQGDVGDRESLANAMRQIPADYPPLRGVFHSAGVLADGTLFDMDLEQLDKPMAPKVQGAWNLHQATLDAPLEMFVLFSSIACVFGSPGQGNYAAGNAFLDGLAHWRRSQGLPATSINWGPWDEVGMAATAGHRELLLSRGFHLLEPAKCLHVLEAALRGKTTQVSVIQADWPNLLKPFGGKYPPVLREIVTTVEATGKPADADRAEDVAFRAELMAAATPEREALLRKFFADQLGRIMGMDPASLDAAQPLNTLGLDSLMAIELRNSMETRLKVRLPMARFMEGPSIATLSKHVGEAMGQGESTAITAAAAGQASGDYPLSYGQQALWFLHRLAPTSPAYNIYGTLRIRGTFDLAAIDKMFAQLIDRHAVLRTTFHEKDGQPVERVHKEGTIPVHVEDASGLSDDQLRRRMVEEAVRPFDLESGPMLRIFVFQRDGEHFLLYVLHHILTDFWSLVVTTEECRQLYEAAVTGTAVELPALPVQYTDFVRWQSEMLASSEGQSHWEYWQKELAGELPALDLPTDRPRPPVQTYRGAQVNYRFDAALSESLRRLTEKHGSTLHSTLLAAYHVLLHRYTGQEDILIGTPTSGRTRAEFAPLTGYFVNPVVIRGDLSGDPSFSSFLEQIRDRMHGALDHQDFPFSLLVERLRPRRDPSRSAIFDTMFATQRTQVTLSEKVKPFFIGDSDAKMSSEGLTGEPFPLGQLTAMFDLLLSASEAEGGVLLSIQYNSDLFDESTVKRMMEHFEVLVRGIVQRPEARISEFPILTGGEAEQLTAQWSAGALRPVPQRCIHELIEEQARKDA